MTGSPIASLSQASEEAPGVSAPALGLPRRSSLRPLSIWLGWASKPEIHWIVPLLATIPYGFSNQMIFMGMINYVADAYGVYAPRRLWQRVARPGVWPAH